MVTVLRLLLLELGRAMALASRFSPRFRRQVTRDRCIVISSDDGVSVAYWFDARTRTMRVGDGRGVEGDCELRFASASVAIRSLLRPRAASAVIEAAQTGRARIEGNAMLVMWFAGLSRIVAPIGRSRRPRRPLPIQPQRHDPAAPYAERITVEPAVHVLPADARAAWAARAKLVLIRVAAGEPSPR